MKKIRKNAHSPRRRKYPRLTDQLNGKTGPSANLLAALGCLKLWLGRLNRDILNNHGRSRLQAPGETGGLFMSLAGAERGEIPKTPKRRMTMAGAQLWQEETVSHIEQSSPPPPVPSAGSGV